MDTRTLCLGALMMGDASGYEIRKQFEEGPFSHFQATSYGAIYPALTKLVADGLAGVSEESQSGRPDRKVYSLTDAGRAAFARALGEPPAPDRIRSDALFQLFFADLMSPERAAQVLDTYRARLAEPLERIDALEAIGGPPDDSAGRAFVRGVGRALYAAVVDYLDENRDALVESLRHRSDREETPS